jgi:hypothetical protein
MLDPLRRFEGLKAITSVSADRGLSASICDICGQKFSWIVDSVPIDDGY